MDADDEFGDLYADIGPETGKRVIAEPFGDERVGDLYDEDDEELLYGTSSSSSLRALPAKPPAFPASSTPRGIQLALTSKEVDHDELLYGQLYGVTAEVAVNAESPLRSSVDIKAMSVSRVEKRQDPREDPRSALEIAEESSFGILVEDRVDTAGDKPGKIPEIPLGGVRMSAGNGERQIDKDGTSSHGPMLETFVNRGLPPDSDAVSLRRASLVSEVPLQMNSPPGLSANARVQPEIVIEEEEEGEEMVAEWEGGVVELTEEGEGPEGDGEDWDSDSEDDIQIVLNDETPMYAGERPADGDEVEGSEDEDEEDLVIVTGDDDALPIEEQEWEEQPMAMDSLPGTLSATLSLGSDRAPGGEDRGQVGKGTGGPGVSSGVPRIGYSGQGYHPHHSQYKYVRPGAGAGSGVAAGMGPQPSQGSPQAGIPSGRGLLGGSVGGWGPGRGSAGRGDWGSGGGRGSAPRTSQGSGGMGSWGASRLFPSGQEFNLPPTKTVFDVDIDSLEEKPWRRPGIDTSDYFNFSFTENSWKQYCRQLAQLRLEATMQSKIRVYESGRSEQEYDPDLPPELAAATGMQEASGDPNSQQQRQQDGGLGTGSGRGRGVGRGRMMLPTGRAIQVEGGGGERRPSADVRRQRSRDSDAVIQIVLQDASEDEPPAPVQVNEGNEEFEEEEEERGGPVLEKDRRFFRSGPPAPWEIEGRPNLWERENMPMGPGLMQNMGPHGGGMMPGHRMDVEGPGPYPLGPGMSMHQPGPGPNFGMFPGAPFGPPPVGRGGMVRPPLYSGPRPGLPPPGQGPPPDAFPPMMGPLEYLEPPRRRTPPHMTPPRRTPPQGLHGDWDDELSNGSGANWTVREGRNHRETKEPDGGNGDWHVDGVERRDNKYPGRRGRETDRSSFRERSVDDASAERSDEQKRSISRERHVEDNDWDTGYSTRLAKKQKVLSHPDNRLKPGREEYSHAKALKSNIRKEEPPQSWELSKDQVAPEEEVSQLRRHDASHVKSSERKGLTPAEDSFGSQRKDHMWTDRLDEELRDRRQPREREELQHRKVKEDDNRQHRGREDQDRERRREDQDRERRHGKKDKEEERIFRDDRSKRLVDDHIWSSRDREETRLRDDVKPTSTERDAEYSKEKRRLVDDRAKLKSRLEDVRESEIEGRLKGRSEDFRESDGRGKGRLEERREGDGRMKGRLEDAREIDGRAKGRLGDVRDSDGRGKGRVEDVRESDGRGKSWLEDLRETDGRAKGRSEDLREGDVRAKPRLEDPREIDVREKARLEDHRESDGRVKTRLEDLRESDGRGKIRAEDPRESDGRVKSRLEDLRESDRRMKGRLEDSRESDGRVRGRSENVRESDGRVKGRLEDIRESDGRTKGRLEDVRENDVRAKRRLDDVRESDGRGKSRLEDLRESDGRGRRYERDDDLYAWDDRRKYEEKSSRADSSHTTRNHLMESRKLVEEHRPHKDKRGWEAGVTTKEVPSERNGSLSGLGEDKSYRSHSDGSKKRRVEEYRTSAQFDKASTRDSDDLAPTSARHKEKKVVLQKRVEDHFARRSHGKDVTSRQHRVSKDDNAVPDNVSSDDDDTDRRGRSKLERWTSRKERDAIAAMGGQTLQKWQNSESGHEEAPSTSQQINNTERMQQQSKVEQHWKDDRKEKHRLSTYSGKRHYESEVKEPSATHGSGGDTAPESQTAAPKDVAEKRKERLERLRLHAEEEAAKRQKNEDSLPQIGSVEEVKQERPARKRRWGNG